MKNRELFIALKNALDLQPGEIVKIFDQGDIQITDEALESLLVEVEGNEKFDNKILEAFLNGFIIYKRGKKEVKPGDDTKKPQEIKIAKHINNVVLKKLKIALSLTNDDMVDLLEEVGLLFVKGDLTPYFRKDNHKHYKRCDDQFLLKFLKGLEIYNHGGF